MASEWLQWTGHGTLFATSQRLHIYYLDTSLSLNNSCKVLNNIMDFPAQAPAETHSRTSTSVLQHRSDRLANISPGEEHENASSRRVVERLETAFAAARTNTRHIDYTVYTTPHPGSPPTEHPEMILPSRSAKKQSRPIRYLLFS